MNEYPTQLRLSLLILPGALVLASCGGSKPAASGSEVALQGRRAEEAARCEFEGRKDRDVQESSAPGSIVPNVRRVFGYIGEGEDRRRILLCREVDTNFDGVKDLVRVYGDVGQKLSEQADSDYDGKVDTWITFGKTKPAKIEIDADGDGKVEQVRYYVAGSISRIQRDTNADGKSDVFEIYKNGRLDRMGIDANFDGQVDRWDRDEVNARLQEEKYVAEQQKADAAAAAD